MDKELFDLSKLSNEDLDEIIHLQKALSLGPHEALMKWSAENPGKVRSLGQFKNGEFISHEITDSGVKEIKGGEGLKKVIDDLLNKKEDDKDAL